MWRVTLGFLVSVLALPLYVFVVSGFDPMAMIIAVPILGFTSFATLFVGLPVYAWCRDHRRVSAWLFLLGGAFAGAICSLPFILMMGSWEAAATLVPYFAMMGIVHAAVFWLVAIFRNHELQEPVAPNAQLKRECQ